MSTRNRWRVLLASAILPLALQGQTVSTELFGLVTDSSGAVIPSAAIRITRLTTGDVRTSATNSAGNYIFSLLDIGDYEITCSAQGFKTEIAHNVTLQLQQKLRLDFHLQVGERAEVVEV